MTIWTPCGNCGQPLAATDHDGGCPFTLRELVRKYGSEGKAAGAVALAIEVVPGLAFTKWPAGFHALVLFKQQMAVLKLSAISAGSSLERLQALWRENDTVGVGGPEDV